MTPLSLSFLSERSEAAELVEVEPYEEGPADDMIVRHEAPDPAVARVVAIIPHHEIMARRQCARGAAVIVVAIVLERARAHPLDERGRVLLDQNLVLDRIEFLGVALHVLHPLLRTEVVPRQCT